MALRSHTDITALVWIDDNHFNGVMKNRRSGNPEACYGWSKGAGFFIYSIGDGHIMKLGSVKRDEIIDGTTGSQEADYNATGVSSPVG